MNFKSISPLAVAVTVLEDYSANCAGRDDEAYAKFNEELASFENAVYDIEIDITEQEFGFVAHAILEVARDLASKDIATRLNGVAYLLHSVAELYNYDVALEDMEIAIYNEVRFLEHVED